LLITHSHKNSYSIVGWLRWTYLADFLEVGRDRIIADRSAFLEEITCANILLQWVKLLPTNDGRKLNQLVKELKRNKIEGKHYYLLVYISLHMSVLMLVIQISVFT